MIITEKYIDLHTHSCKSDGSMTPAELVRHAKASGLAAVALSDHDNCDGVAEAVAEGERIGIEVVPAIELSAISDTETHILGYYIDINNRHFLQRLEDARRVRVERLEQTCAALRDHGFDVTMEEAGKYAGSGVLCRAHFARLMADKGYVKSPKEAFDLWLGNGRPCCNNKQCFTDEECVQLIKEAGGLSFVAHLHLTRKPQDELEKFLIRLKGVGLDGVEGYYTEYTPQMQQDYQSMAKRLGLLISGGTDFHGTMKPHISIGTGLGNMKIPYSVLENIKKYRSHK